MNNASTYTFGVRGMTCAACSARVERIASKIDGVTDARVNLVTERLELEGTLGDSTADELANALSGRGYELVRAAAPAQLVAQEDDARAREFRTLTHRMWLAMALGMPVMIVSMILMFVPGLMHWHHDPRVLWPMWALATIVQFGAGWEFYRGAVHSLRGGVGDMNLLVALGSSVAWLWSTVGIAWPSDGHAIYLEASASVIALVLLGRWMEHRARHAASDAVSRLMDLRPPTVRRFTGASTEDIPVEDVLVGDRLLVRVGERFAVDAILTDEPTDVDESILTGESVPVRKSAGDFVAAGTTNVGAPVSVRAARVGDDTTLSRIVDLVRTAQADRPAVQAYVDRVIAVFVPVVVAIAVATALFWFFWSGATDAMLHAVAVLVVACPCAMGLATPISLFVATSRGASEGLVFRRASALETLAQVDTIAFDKTGTLTAGEPRMAAIQTAADVTNAQVVAIAAGVEAHSEHPLSRAFVAHAKALDVTPDRVRAVRVVAGAGMRAEYDADDVSTVVRIGRRQWLVDEGVDFASMDDSAVNESALTSGATIVWMSFNQRAVAAFLLADEARDDAAAMVKALHEQGIRTVLLSGDAKEPVNAVANAVGVTDIYFRMKPEDKAGFLADLRKDGRTVAFVGDGINDAPALAQAAVGIAMGSASDVSLETGDLVLPGNRLSAIPRALALARATMTNIRWNLVWAFGYNVVLIPAAAGAMTWIHPWLSPSPTLAALAMSFSSVFVVGNALRLRGVSLG
jgi:Cu+-exporting ATPase